VQLDREPAASSRPPPTEMRRDPATPGETPTQPPAATGTPRQQPPRTEPPPGHVTMPAPTVPGETQPQRSEGAGQIGQSPIGPRPGGGPDASTTRAPEAQPAR
jgi:hypothetical protein